MGKLPIYKVEGVPFRVDVESGLLVHHRTGAAELQFREMRDMGTHYLAYFNMANGKLTGYKSGAESIEVKIPQMVALDPRGIARMYHIDTSRLPARDSELRCDPELFRQRQSGKQPVIDICGYTYFVKLAFDVLEPKDFTRENISLWDMRRSRFDTGYCFMFDTVNPRLIRKKERQDKEALRDRAVWVKIPHVSVLDPYIFQGFHQREGTPETLRFPIRYNLKARVFDLDWNEISGNKLKIGHKKMPQQQKSIRR